MKFNILEKINKYVPTLLVITTIIGLIFVVQQLKEFNRQNETLYSQSELLRRSLVQSYRPIGYIMQIHEDDPDKRIVEYRPNKGRKDKFSFVYHQSIINEGTGILVDIGHIFFISKKKVIFRDKFLKGEYDSTMIKFDFRFDYSRRHTLLPNDIGVVTIAYDNIEFEDEYNIYLLHFYEDQDGNLYDTENNLNLKFGPTSIVNNRVVANLKTIFTNNIYNAYSEVEKTNLINILKKYNHDLWKYITLRQ